MIRLSASLIKKIWDGEPKVICPRKLKYETIDRLATPSDDMQKGNYFESLCIGKGANGQVTEDLPRLKTGKKSVDQERIEAQADLFKLKISEFNINLNNVQKEISVFYDWRDKAIQLHGTVDIVSPINIVEEESLQEKNYDYAIIDLKLTGNIYNEFGDFSWAFPANMDHTQASMYVTILEHLAKSVVEDGEYKKFIVKDYPGLLEAYTKQQEIPFFYWVWDYKPNSEDNLFRKKVESEDKVQLLNSIDACAEIYEKIEFDGWQAIPKGELCSKCQLKSSCDKAIKRRTIKSY